jgi:hypothetical protein
VFTADGLGWLGGLVAPLLSDAVMVVSDGDQRAEQPVSRAELDGPEITVSATFGEQDANFEWKVREVVLGGVVLDRDEADGGRKVSGAIWEARTVISLAGE